MRKLYFLFYTFISFSGFSQTILNQQENTTRTVQDPNVVVLAPGFHAASSVSNPFVAKIGDATENPGGGPVTPSTAGSTNPSGTTAPEGKSFHDTQGNIEVNGGGQLQFTLPIALPPGVKSVAPQINLVYTSGSGNGIAGYGWNISGITAISRVGKNIEKDGEIKGIQLDYSDYYSFNGQRLILKSGSHASYGEDGAEYVTEKYSNVKIKSVGTIVGHGPQHWEVTFEDGSQAWYGLYGKDEYLFASSRTPLEYNISKWKDAQGNYITYNYSQSFVYGNVAIISSIEWGGNEKLNLPHFNKMQFNYNADENSTRSLKENSYVNGFPFVQDKLLSNIVVTTNGDKFKKYEIKYKKLNTSYQFVDYIKEKNSADEEANTVVFENNTDGTVTNLFRQDSRFDDLRGKNFSGDFNGDGKLDIIKNYTLMLSRLDGTNNFKNVNYDGNILAVGTYADAVTPLNNQVLITGKVDSISKKFNVFFYKYQNEDFNKIAFKEIDLSNYSYLFESADPSSDPRCTLESSPDINFIGKEIDFNGDGLSELILVLSNVNTWRCPDYDGTTYIQTTSNGSIALYIDFHNNKIMEVNENGHYIDYENTSVIDLDGDGKVELLENTQLNTISFFSFDTQSGTFSKKIADIQRGGSGGIRPNPVIGDYNGDGKTDILLPNGIDSSDWKMYVSTGSGFKEFYYSNLFLYQPSWQGSPRKSRNIQRTYAAPDFNKDGKSDFVIFESQVWFRDGIKDWNNPDSSYGFNYLRNEGVDTAGKPIFSNDYNIAPKELNWDGEDINYSMYGEHYIPLFGNFRIAQLNTDFAIIHKTKLITWDLGSKLNKISRLKSITQGGLKTDVDYAPLTSTGNIYKSYYDTNPVQYPFANLTENLNYEVVSKLTQGLRKQEFRYRDFIGHLHGKGMIGFRQTARSTWFADGAEYENTKIWSGSEINPINEGLPYKDWSIKTTEESNVFPKDISIINSKLLSFKQYEYKVDKLLNGAVVTSYSDADKPKVVTSINPYITISKDFQKDIKTVHTVISYDTLYLPTKSTTDVNDGFAVTTAEISYSTPITTGSSYSIGKPLWKKEKIEAYGDTKGAKEEYTYTGNLLTKKRTFDRNNSEYIDETYLYDVFGNVIQKQIENPNNNDAVGAAVTKSQYDDQGRFVIKKTDNLGLETHITYNNWGQIFTQTDPFNNKLTNTYDSWGKLLTSKTDLGGKTTYTYEKLSNGDSKVTVYFPNNDQKISYTNKLGQNYKSTVKGIAHDSFVSQEVEYDVLGRKYKETEPYFEGTSATQWNKTEYDEYSRPIKVISFTGKIIETVYNGRTATATETNANKRFKTQVYDPLGNISSSTDKGGTIDFKYNAAGENIEAIYGANIVKIGYDQWGRRNFFYDPSNSKDEAHAYRYEYNGYGQLINASSPKGEKYYFYNERGQLTDQAEASSNMFSGDIKQIKFEYNSKGLITKKYGTSNGKPYSSYVNYDSQGRVLSSGEESNGKYFLKKGISYDDTGRVVSYEKGLYSSGIYTKAVIENIYGTWNGAMYQLKDKTSGKTLWELTETDAKGNVVKAKFGGTSIENTYNSNSLLTNVLHKNTANTNTLLQLSYSFNAIKNELNSRITGGSLNILETFEYDENNRLLNWTNPKSKTGQLSNNVYDSQGRIKENDQVGIIKFDNATKIYQPTGFTLNTAGQQNLANDLIQKITYNENNDPVFIEGVNGDVAFEYGLNSMRQKVTYGGNFGKGNDGKYTKFYSEDGGYEIVLDHTTGKEKHVIYIGGSPYDSNIIYLKNYQEATASYKFLHKDYLGSILAISDEAGNVLEQRHFDAWGNLTLFKINGRDQDIKQFNDLSLIDRGYTSHEHYMEVGIIHMNGRLYDPLLRRFLNADENIQDPHNTQVYNKYAYVINNPLAYTDISGEDFGISAVLIAIGTAIFTSMATDYYLNRPVNLENMFQSVVMSVMSAGIANGIGDVFRVGGKIAEALGKTGTIIARAGAHAITQGVFSSVQGGNFWSGALSGAFASVAGDLLKLGTQNAGEFSVARSDAFKMLTGAVMGGIGSKLGGGNFWMGAAQGLVVTVFNHMAIHEPPPEDFKGNRWLDYDTGDIYGRNTSGKMEIEINNIEEIMLYSSGANFRRNASGISKMGNIISQVGLGLTVSVFGAQIGVPLMAIGGGISLAADASTSLSYLFEKKTEKFYQTAIPTVTSYLLGRATGGILRTPARNGKILTTKAVTEVVTYGQGEFTQPIMEHVIKTN